VGFDFRHLPQVVMKSRHSDNILCLCGFQALFQLRACCLRRLPTTSIDHENGITGISSDWRRVKVSLRFFPRYHRARRSLSNCTWPKISPRMTRGYFPGGTSVHYPDLGLRCIRVSRGARSVVLEFSIFARARVGFSEFGQRHLDGGDRRSAEPRADWRRFREPVLDHILTCHNHK